MNSKKTGWLFCLSVLTRRRIFQKSNPCQNRYDFTVLLDKETKVVSLYNPDKTVPYTSIIDRDGNFYYSKISYAPGDEVELKKKVISALEGKTLEEAKEEKKDESSEEKKSSDTTESPSK